MMKRFLKVIILFLWILLFDYTLLRATHVRGGFITATLIDNNNLTYRIALNSFVDTGSTVLFGGGLMDFGDGSVPVQFEAGKPDFYKLLDEEVAMNVFYFDHSFPGPGVYTLGYREFNRNASIANMDNSVNTPFYIETQITIDPYLGANSSSRIMNYFPFKNNINQPYIFPLSLTDPDGDSISVEPAKPLQDKGTPVSNYFVPANYDGDKVVSRLQLHTPSNEIIWANPLEEDEYNYAVKIREWRYNHSENTWTEMGYTLFDFQMIFLDRLGGPPVIRQLKDTVVLFSNSFEEEITILDDNTDSMKVWISGNLPETIELKTTIDQDIYYPTPLQEVISVTNTADLLAPGPYKIVVSMNPKQYHSTSSQKSAMLWVTDHTGRPDAPSGLKVDRALNNKIIISWQDQSGDEAGYSIDRADSYFPEFIRIAALPENSIQYIDENVIPNRDYYYRVRAMGTEGSADSEILEVKEQDIITGMDDFSTDSGIILYPIPAGDQLFIRTDGIIQWPAVIVVLDLNGRILQRTALGYSMNSTPIVIPIGELIPGLYFLQITSAEFTFRQKFVKNK